MHGTNRSIPLPVTTTNGVIDTWSLGKGQWDGFVSFTASQVGDTFDVSEPVDATGAVYTG